MNARRAWPYALALAVTGGGLPFAFWTRDVVEPAEPALTAAPETRLDPEDEDRNEPSGAPGAGGPATTELGPGVTKTRLFGTEEFIHAAVPFRESTPAHPRGTIVVATSTALFEIDVDKASVVRRADSPCEGHFCRLAATPFGLAVTWMSDKARIAFYDERLEHRWTNVVGTHRVFEVSAEQNHAVVASDIFPPGAGFDLVRFDMATGQRVVAKRHPGSVGIFDEYPAMLVVRNESVHVVVTRPRIEVRSYDLELNLKGVVRLPLPPRREADVPPFGTLDATEDGLLACVRSKVFLVTPGNGRVKRLPKLPSRVHNENSLDVSPSGLVLIDGGFLAERVGGPFVELAPLGTETSKRSRSEVPVYLDAPAAGFFLGDQALIVTNNPEASLIRIDPEQALSAR